MRQFPAKGPFTQNSAQAPKMVKGDPRFSGIPVIMHSSLSGFSNQKLGQSVGVDGYVPKFEPHKLSEMIAEYLLRDHV